MERQKNFFRSRYGTQIIVQMQSKDDANASEYGQWMNIVDLAVYGTNFFVLF